MDSAAVNNRLLVVMAGAIVSPWLDKRFGVQLSPVDTAALLVLIYHYAATACTKGIAAFKLYFPPPIRPTQPEIPASTETTK
jgi:hypothetical protein